MNKLDQIAEFAFSFKPTVLHSYAAALTMLEHNIPGDFVECGVAAGAQIAAMQWCMVEQAMFRNIIAFDSFEGIPLAGPMDREQPGFPGPIAHDVNLPERDRLRTSGVTAFSEEQVTANFRRLELPLENIKLVKGWFQDTVPNYPINSIALLRLDGDLYESTKVCLDNLYPKVVIGGMVIIDDYALAGCRRAVDEFLIARNEIPVIRAVEGGQGPVWWIKYAPR